MKHKIDLSTKETEELTELRDRILARRNNLQEQRRVVNRHIKNNNEALKLLDGILNRIDS